MLFHFFSEIFSDATGEVPLGLLEFSFENYQRRCHEIITRLRSDQSVAVSTAYVPVAVPSER
jgi:hypothetical protein